MTRYAEATTVSADRSRAEIERIVQRYGATQFGYGWNEGADHSMAVVTFRCHDRLVRFVLPLPSPSAREFSTSPTGRRRRTADQARAAWEQTCRQRWRALALAIKAKLEAVEADITTFEDEFLAHIVDPATGKTVGEVIRPALARSYAALPGKAQPLLLTAE
ncbi:MAG: hypothetical protein JW809_19445 [Pirellulales bacterium]|nr:hypothetical protein [Pirellulales bacterium]